MNYKIRTPDAETFARAKNAIEILDIEFPLAGYSEKIYGIAVSDGKAYRYRSQILYINTKGEEITLHELERKAADYLFANSPEFKYYQPSDYEATSITESPNEAQKRYDEAVIFLRTKCSCEYTDFGSAFYVKDIYKALKIAAGIS